jgi:protein disulfide-isomerase
MKNLLLLCVLAGLASVGLFRLASVCIGEKPAGPASANVTWLTDFSAAKQHAAGEKKKLLLDFTGSDWCYYCQQLETEVLSTDAFKDFAKDYVLVRIDFPRSTELPPALKHQNDSLAQQFHIDGYPTLVELSPAGQEITRQTGYDPGSGPQAYLSQFK